MVIKALIYGVLKVLKNKGLFLLHNSYYKNKYILLYLVFAFSHEDFCANKELFTNNSNKLNNFTKNTLNVNNKFICNYL